MGFLEKRKDDKKQALLREAQYANITKIRTIYKNKPFVYTELKQTNLASVVKKVRCFDIDSIPIDSNIFPYTETLTLEEDVRLENGIPMRTDFIMVHNDGVLNISGDRIGFNSKYIRRLDDMIYLLSEPLGADELVGEVKIDDSTEIVMKNSDAMKQVDRVLTSDGWEVYCLDKNELLEVQSSVCTECETCHECIPEYGYNHRGNMGRSIIDLKEMRDIRTFKINKPMLAVLYKTGVHIASVKHPCKYRNLQETIHSEHKIVDPPEIKIVFPYKATPTIEVGL